MIICILITSTFQALVETHKNQCLMNGKRLQWVKEDYFCTSKNCTREVNKNVGSHLKKHI